MNLKPRQQGPRRVGADRHQGEAVIDMDHLGRDDAPYPHQLPGREQLHLQRPDKPVRIVPVYRLKRFRIVFPQLLL